MNNRSEEPQTDSDVTSIKDQFEAAWQAGNHPSIDEYLGKGSPDIRADLLVELIQIELWHRREESPPPRSDTYKDHFADDTHGVDVAFEKFHERSAGMPERYTDTESIDRSDGDTKSLPTDDTSTLLSTPKRSESHVVVEPTRKIGRYTVVQELGQGGQGAVYRAVHPNLPIELAIKISIKTFDSNFQQALRDEAKILCDLDHPGIARVRDLDFYQGRPFLVLDFIRGRSLRERLRSGEIPQEQAVGWLATVARAIDFAHRRGIVHLDLKPDNIVIDENDEPKVIDFGLARMRDAWTDSGTEEDRVSGTLHYMSPEQAEGTAQKIGSQSDVFALGAILYHILVGTPPFEGRGVRNLLAAIRCGEFDRKPLESSKVPPELAAACLKAMSFDPQERYASAADFADAIEPQPSSSGGSVLASPRVFLWGAALAVTTVALVFLFGRNPSGSEPDVPASGAAMNGAFQDPAVDSIESAESSVPPFAITHIGNEEDGVAFTAPLFENRPAREEDDVRITSQFAQPVYCFLFALNPDGAVQLCYPDSESKVQSEPISQLVYPSDESLTFGLTDGEGHQAFVLVTSEAPLPSFGRWKSDLLQIPWPDETIAGDWVYSDGNLTSKDFFAGQRDRVKTRGKIRLKQEPTALKRYLDSMGTTKQVEVHGVVFEVRAGVF